MSGAQTVGGITKISEFTPTLDTNAYASGDAMSSSAAIISAASSATPAKSGMIQSVIVTDLAKQDAAIDLIFFDADPSSTTITTNTALTVDDADLPNIIGVVQVTAYADFADNSVGFATNLAIPYVADSNGRIYAVPVCRGTPTYAVGDLNIRVGLLLD